MCVCVCGGGGAQNVKYEQSSEKRNVKKSQIKVVITFFFFGRSGLPYSCTRLE